MRFVKEFKEFALRGNVMDLAVGMIIGSAFGKITTSLVNDIIMPAVSMLLGGINFSDWRWLLRPAQLAPDGTELTAAISINYGTFLSVGLDFLILALAIFCMVRFINRLRSPATPQEETPPAPPPPSPEELLLTEIRDLLQEKRDG